MLPTDFKKGLIVMNKLSKPPVIIFVTFVVTSALYLGAYMFVPMFSNALSNTASLITPSATTEFNKKMREIDNIIDNYFITDPDKKTLETKAARAYVAALGDEYTEYYTPAEYEELNADISGNYKGIGVEVTVTEDNLITVITAYDGSPAQKGGIKGGDKLIKVNGIDINGDNYSQAINMMRGVGKYGESDEMTLTVKRDTATFDTKVVREKVEAQMVRGEILEGSIGYIKLTQFATESAKAFELELNRLKSQGAKSLIIDLRNNPGGMLTSVVEIADLLLPEGKILTIKGKNGPENEYMSNKGEVDMPMCVLVNGMSASASEVLAGALKDHKKATIIGEKTYGKGVVQSIFELDDNSALKITTSKYYTPSGKCLDKKGIKPDIEVKMELDKNLGLYEMDEDIQLKRAIEELQK